MSEALYEERKYSESNLRTDFAKYTHVNKVKKRELKKLWSEIYSAWYANNIHSYDDLVIFVKRMDENITGGAGFAVYGGGTRGGFGNPGRSGAMGGSQNLGGGPNLMYTYSVKPLTQDLQQPATPQDDEETIHAGSKIRGKIQNGEGEVTGQIIHAEEDHDNNIKYYLVLDPETGKQVKIDPTSAYLIRPEEFLDPFIDDDMAEENLVDESFYPNLDESDKSYIRFDVDPRELKDQYPDLFGTYSFAIIANELQNLNPGLFTQEKLDLAKFYTHIKGKGYRKTFPEMKENLLNAAPLLGITNSLKLTRSEKSDLKFQEKMLSGKYDVEHYMDCEIPAEEAGEKDYVIRSKFTGETEPAYYRGDCKKDEHDLNMLKGAYASKYGNPEKTLWRNYLDARPATVGHVDKHGKSHYGTRDVGDYEGDVYENFYPTI